MADASHKTAIVTGGSRGIGRAVVNRLRWDGHRVFTCGRSARPDDLPEDIGWAEIDVSDPHAAEHLVREAGPAVLLVNNAGIQIEKTVLETTDAEWDLLVDTNCRGVFNMCRAALPAMLREGGVIVNIGSISGSVSDHGMAIYNASKAFVESLTRSIAVDHGPAVRCNAVSPGWIMTGMADSAFAAAKNPQVAMNDALARHAAGRFGQPEDVANAVAWLASDEARFMTGACLTIDGGLTAGSPLKPGLF
jgi:meso-butanediol dehydrogenase/(S,S)-butanediol dehydrogenase/diacetyl reductase